MTAHERVRYHYTANGGERFWFETSRPPRRSVNLRQIAELCADAYDSDHDGWEGDWPVDIVVYEFKEDGTGAELWRGIVDKEIVPQFHAHEEQKQNGQ